MAGINNISQLEQGHNDRQKYLLRNGLFHLPPSTGPHHCSYVLFLWATVITVNKETKPLPALSQLYYSNK